LHNYLSSSSYLVTVYLSLECACIQAISLIITSLTTPQHLFYWGPAAQAFNSLFPVPDHGSVLDN
jgi:hypothetical protein